jgi:Short C-terminal domain
VFAVWAKRQALETDTWAKTSSKMLENEDIRDAVAGFLVEQLFAAADVQGRLEKALPPDAKPLAGPASGGLREFADNEAPKLLERPRVQALWEQANRAAHEQLLAIVEGRSGTVSNQGGDVTLDLRILVQQLAAQTGLPNVADKIPEDKAQIVILHSDELEAAQDGVDLLNTLAWLLTVIALALYALAVYLAGGWRREALRSVGLSFIAVGIAALIARSIAGGAVVSSLATTAAAEPAASAAWSIGTSVLAEIAGAMVLYGIFIVISAWLAGRTKAAVAVRREIAPYYHEPVFAYATLAVIVALLFWWAPTEGLRRPLSALILIGFLALGTEVLRRQVSREFPHATRETAAERWTERMSGLRQRVPRGRAARARAPDESDDPLARLERLGALKRDGLLTDEEFEAQKKSILAG